MYNLVRALCRIERPFFLKIFCKPIHVSLFRPLLQPGDQVVSVSIRNRAHLLAYYELGLPRVLRREHVRLFHATHYLTPPVHSTYRLITTVHDMGFFLYPDKYPWLKRAYFRQRFATFLKRADRVWTVSHSTRHAVAAFFPEFHAKLETIYPGVDHLGAVEPQASIPIPQPYFLSVNSIEKRKNIPFLIQLFNRVKASYLRKSRLVIVGYPANGFEAVKRAVQESPFKKDIFLYSNVHPSTLKALYAQALCFFSASEYEGFGFTPFEAVWMGLPAFLFYNNTVAELLGDSPYHFHHFQIDQWVDVWHQAYRQHFPERLSIRQIQHLSWEETARKAVQLYLQVLDVSEETPAYHREGGQRARVV